MANNFEPLEISTREDFKLAAPVKWCAGCGGHSVLSTITNVLPETGIPKEKVVFVSGIGCSSRFPYYINTYGFHSMHGRANPIASGIKAANPNLSVWVVTGDGDSMAIGGNHFIHLIRRNINVNYLRPEGSFYLFLDLRDRWDGLSDDEKLEGMIQAGVIMSPGEAFGKDYRGLGVLRFCHIPEGSKALILLKVSLVLRAARTSIMRRAACPVFAVRFPEHKVVLPYIGG